MRDARDLGRLLWHVALEGVCGGIVVALAFVALSDLHPAFVLPLVGLAIVVTLARPASVPGHGGDGPSGPPADDAGSPQA